MPAPDYLPGFEPPSPQPPSALPRSPPDPSTIPQHLVRVAVERNLDRSRDQHHQPDTLTYADPSGILAPGDRVELPLGHSTAAGIVIAAGGHDLLDGLDPRKLRPATRRGDLRIPHTLIELAQWLSTYYACPLGLVLASMLPASVKRGTGQRLERKLARPADASADDPRLGSLTPAARRLWPAILALPASTFPIDAADLALRIAATNRGPINRLADAGLLEHVTVTTVRTAGPFAHTAEADHTPSLTDHQHHAVDGIARTLDRFATHLLFGVTGSGKTEVYLHLIQRVLDLGRSAICLVPEIALTPQTAGRFLARFGDHTVAVLHSGLSASARHAQWAAAAQGRARVVVGARSAVFAPLDRLGLIIVDEEHDTSYKQDQLPRYHARDVAIKRAQLANCPVILGSATPSLESWNATLRQRSTLWRLPARATGAPMPAVEIVDRTLDIAPPADGPRQSRLFAPSIGARLTHALTDTLTSGGQAILLLNRRGHSSVLACADRVACRWTMTCLACDAGMVLHKRPPTAPGQHTDLAARPGYLRCHHCLAEHRRPHTCPQCSRPLIALGEGTQRIEEELEQRFAHTLGLTLGRTALRLDSDSMHSAAHYFDALDRFRRGEVRLLLGTQMIAKGLDFPNVRLVGIINADTALSLPDFRAAERTFQLVAQVAGRAGRGDHPGLVIVQTMFPREPAITLAAAHDFDAFAAHELPLRVAARVPPASRLTRIIIRHEQSEQADARIAALHQHLRDAIESLNLEHSITLDPPAPCAIARIADHHRREILLWSPSAAAITHLLTTLRAAGHLRADAHTAIDVDPVSLL